MSKELKLLTYPDFEDYLYCTSTPVSHINKEIVSIGHKIAEIMYKSGEIALSAPQVGINKRIIVMNCSKNKNETIFLINPAITWQSEASSQRLEECLSYPGLKMPIRRPNKIKIEGIDLNGRKVAFEASGLFARAVCQHIDHLNGVPYTQRARRQVRKHLFRKWKQESES